MDGAPQMSYVFLFSPRKPSRLDWSCLFKACQVHGGVCAPWINLNMAAIVRWMKVESQYFFFFCGADREPLSRRINEHKASVNRPDEWRPERWAGSHFNSLWSKHSSTEVPFNNALKGTLWRSPAAHTLVMIQCFSPTLILCFFRISHMCWTHSRPHVTVTQLIFCLFKVWKWSAAMSSEVSMQTSQPRAPRPFFSLPSTRQGVCSVNSPLVVQLTARLTEPTS